MAVPVAAVAPGVPGTLSLGSTGVVSRTRWHSTIHWRNKCRCWGLLPARISCAKNSKSIEKESYEKLGVMSFSFP